MFSMIDCQLYDNENEMKMHTGAIRLISLKMDIPYEKVCRLYEIVLRRYKEQARIKDFLVLLAGRRVKYLLQKWRSQHFKKLNG